VYILLYTPLKVGEIRWKKKTGTCISPQCPFLLLLWLMAATTITTAMASAPSTSWKSRFVPHRTPSKDRSASSKKSDESTPDVETSLSSSQPRASKSMGLLSRRLRQLLPSPSQTRLSARDASSYGEEQLETKPQTPQASEDAKSSSFRRNRNSANNENQAPAVC
jgi:hypothetical protein